jgi:subtilisin family serine protease
MTFFGHFLEWRTKTLALAVYSLWMALALGTVLPSPAFAGGSIEGSIGADEGSGPGTMSGGARLCTETQVIVPELAHEVESDPIPTETITMDDGTQFEAKSRFLMVAFYWGTSETAIVDVLNQHNLGVRDAFPETFVVNVCWDDERSLGDVAQSLWQEPVVEDVMPNLAVEPAYNPTEVWQQFGIEKYYPPSPDNVDEQNPLDWLQWWIAKAKFHKAWNKLLDEWQEEEDQQVKVAVVDTGVDRYRTDTAYAGHPDFINSDGSNQITLWGVSAGRSYGKGTACGPNRGFPPDNVDAHGTAVAGIIGAAHNGTGIAGITMRYAQIVPVQVRITGGQDSKWWTAALINALYKIWECRNNLENPRIINISYAIGKYGWIQRQTEYVPLWRAVHYLYERGYIVIAAAGNTGEEKEYYPAAWDFALGVTGLSRLRCKGDWFTEGSVYGIWYDASGYFGKPSRPGNPCGESPTFFSPLFQGLVTLDIRGSAGFNPGNDFSPSGDYHDLFSGTSAATPMVTGLVALMRVLQPWWTFSQVRQALIDSSEGNLDAPLFGELGCKAGQPNCKLPGIINAEAAVILAHSGG